MKYTVQNLPKDMAFKLTKSKDWFSQYAWFEYPQNNEAVVQTGKENLASNQKDTINKRATSILKNSTKNLKTNKNVKFTNEQAAISIQNKDLITVTDQSADEKD